MRSVCCVAKGKRPGTAGANTATWPLDRTTEVRPVHDPGTPAAGRGAVTAIGGRAEPRPVAGPVVHDVRFVGETITAACGPCGWRGTLETRHTATQPSRPPPQHAREPSRHP